MYDGGGGGGVYKIYKKFNKCMGSRKGERNDKSPIALKAFCSKQSVYQTVCL